MHTRATVIMLAALLTAGATACGTTATSKPAAGSSAPDEAITPDVEEETPTEEPGDKSYGLNDTVTYTTGVELGLSKFTRGTSSEYASPENTSYLKFTAKVANRSDSTIDLSAMSISCLYGEDGQQGEQIFDDGLDMPTTHLRPGKSINVTTACELPKDERYVQIEISPDFESETAIFAGDVK
jgi:hypothetical protein